MKFLNEAPRRTLAHPAQSAICSHGLLLQNVWWIMTYDDIYIYIYIYVIYIYICVIYVYLYDDMIYWHTLDFQTPQVMLEYLAIGFWNQLSLGIRLLCARVSGSWLEVCMSSIVGNWILVVKEPCNYLDHRGYIEQSAIPQLRSHASRTKTTRFQNQTTRFPNQSRRASTTTFSRFHNQNVTISQQKYFHSTTKLPRFHNQNLRIQPNSHDSTTNNYWFHQEDCRYLLSL